MGGARALVVLDEPVGRRGVEPGMQEVVQRLRRIARAGQHDPSRRDPRQLGDERHTVRGPDVLEHVEAQHDVEGGVWERQQRAGPEDDGDHRGRRPAAGERDVGADERHVRRQAGEAVRAAADVEDRVCVVEHRRHGRVAREPAQHDAALTRRAATGAGVRRRRPADVRGGALIRCPRHRRPQARLQLSSNGC